MSPSNSYVEALISSVVVFVLGLLGENQVNMKSWEGELQDGISAFM